MIVGDVLAPARAKVHALLSWRMSGQPIQKQTIDRVRLFGMQEMSGIGHLVTGQPAWKVLIAHGVKIEPGRNAFVIGTA